MIKLKFEIKYNDEVYGVNPSSVSDEKHTRVDGTRYLRKTIDAATLTGVDYRNLNPVFESLGQCDVVEFIAYEKFGFDWEVIFKGKFDRTGIKSHAFKCYHQLTIESNDLMSKIEARKDVGINTTDLIVSQFYLNSLISDNVYIYNDRTLEDEDGNNIISYLALATSEPEPSVEALVARGLVPENEAELCKIQAVNPCPPGAKVYVLWAYRITLPKISGESQQAPTNYTLISGNATESTYQRKPDADDRLDIRQVSLDEFALSGYGDDTEDLHYYEASISGDIYLSPINIPAVGISPRKYWYNKRDLQHECVSLDYLFENLLDGLDTKVVSDFLQINPENPAVNNYVTGGYNRLDNLRLGLNQRVGFKSNNISYSHDGSLYVPVGGWISSQKEEWEINFLLPNYASRQEITLDEVLKFLKYAFNADHTVQTISGVEVLRIEHLSYYEDSPNAVDLREGDYKNFSEAFINFEYTNEELPKKEVFSQSEYQSSDFADNEITYVKDGANQSCISASDKNHPFGVITTDVQKLYEKNDIQSRSGFVCVAVDPLTENVINEVGIITNVNQSNGHLATANLIDKYHRSGRSSGTGQINGVETTFNSSLKTKKSNMVVQIHEKIDLSKGIINHIGKGEVVDAVRSLKTNRYDINILYP